jgi:hypothetical protein
MKIIIAGSLTATNEILKIRDKLESAGHQVEIPHGCKNLEVRRRVEARQEIIHSEEADEKLKYDVIKKYYELIKAHEVLLVVNPERKNIPGYIGGNTLIEMAFAHVLAKKIYCLYSLPEMSYKAELLAMKPVILNGDLSKLK